MNTLDAMRDEIWRLKRILGEVTGDNTRAPRLMPPQNLTVRPGFRALHLKWENQSYGALPHTEILLGTSEIRADAAPVARVQANAFSIMSLDILTTYWVWIRGVNVITQKVSDWAGPVSGTTLGIGMDDFLDPITTESELVQQVAAAIDPDVIMRSVDVDAYFENHSEVLAGLILAVALQNDEDWHGQREDLAEAKRELRTEIQEGISSMVVDRDYINARLAEADALVIEERAVRATSDAAAASAREALAARIDDVDAAVLAERTARVSALSAEASSREALAVRVDGAQATIEENASVLASVDGNVRAQYTLKVQAVGDHLAVAGMGMLADGQTGTSEFAILADKFVVYDPDTGTLKPVFLLTENKAMLDGSLIATGTIQGDRINAMSRIQLGAGGEFVMGQGSLFQIADGAILMDGGTGRLKVTNPAAPTTSDYVEIVDGKVMIYKYLNGSHRLHTSLTRSESGVAANGVTVTLPGYWASAPRITVSPAKMQTYDARYPAQSQTLELAAENLTEYAANQYRFTPRARLVLGGGTTDYATVNHSAPVPSSSGGTYVTPLWWQVPGNAGTINAELRSAFCVTTSEYVSGQSEQGGWYEYYLWKLFKGTMRARIRWRVRGTTPYTVTPWSSVLSYNRTNVGVERVTNLSFSPGTSSAIEMCIEFETTATNPVPPDPESAYYRKELSQGQVGWSGANFLRWDKVQYEFAAATVLAGGTMNWTAIGE